MAFATVRTYPGAIDSLLKSPGSDVAKELSRFGTRVETQAKINASGRPGPNVVTGRLRASIGWRLEYGGDIALLVGFGAYYGIYLEKGYSRGGTYVHYPFLEPAIKSMGGSIGSFS